MKYAEIRTHKNDNTELSDVSLFFSGLYGLLNRSFIERFWGNKKFLSLEILKKKGKIHFYFATDDKIFDDVCNILYSVYKDSEIKELEDPIKGDFLVKKIKFSKPHFMPTKTYEAVEEQFLNQLLSNLANGDGMQVVVTAASRSFYLSADRYIKDLDKKENQSTFVLQQKEAVVAKVLQECFETSIRLFSKNKEMLNKVSVFSQLQTNTTQITSGNDVMDALVSRRISSAFSAKSAVLSAPELTSIFHLPNSNTKVDNINYLNIRQNMPPDNLSKNGLHIGFASYRGLTKQVKQANNDRRRHTYIIGQTGTGKSELLKYMAYQDISKGKGVAFIDPHGIAVEDILKVIPESRIDDVIYFAPFDREKPLGLNILDVDSEEQKHIVINSFIALLYKLYDPEKKGMVGPRLERTVRNIMLTGMSEKGNTLIEVLRLITDYEFAKSKVQTLNDPLVKRYWTDEIQNTNDFHKSETLGYFSSKFDRFVTEQTIRNIIGQKRSTLNFDEVLGRNKILLVNLSKGLLGEENSIFLGYLLISKILIAAMGRAGKTNFDDFYLYVDEFQNFATPDFVTILSEARKYKLNLVVANQFTRQLNEDIKNAVFGNVGTILSFRIGSDDAQSLHSQFKQNFEEQDLINLGVGEVIGKLLIDGKPSDPFNFYTPWEDILDIKNLESIDLAQKIKSLSSLKYGRDKRHVDFEIKSRISEGA